MKKRYGFFKKNGEPVFCVPYFPVGSIIHSASDANPSTYWKYGKWQLIAQGRTLVGVDPNDADFDKVGKTGGSKFMQKHTHPGINWLGDESGNQDISLNSGLGPGYNTGWQRTNENYTPGGGIFTYPAGTGDSGNLQPYYTCYIWLRIA